MQIREDLQEEEHIPVWNTLTGECIYIKHTPTLNVEYMWCPDDSTGLNDEGANTILLIHHGEGQVYERSVGAHRAEDDPRPRQIIKDTLVYAISIDWEDKERTSCVPEVPAATEEQREALHDKAQGKVNGTEDEDFLAAVRDYLRPTLSPFPEDDDLRVRLTEKSKCRYLRSVMAALWGKQFD